MTEFHSEITHRAVRAIASLHDAQETGDDYLVEIRQAELQGLARLASEHGLRIPELRDYNAA
jgi:hypothetical protein